MRETVINVLLIFWGLVGALSVAGLVVIWSVYLVSLLRKESGKDE